MPSQHFQFISAVLCESPAMGMGASFEKMKGAKIDLPVGGFGGGRNRNGNGN
jgi:hypothetical protein